MTDDYVYQPIISEPGINPETDNTALTSSRCIYSDKIRFFQGFPEKIGGNQAFIFNNSAVIMGVPRTLYGIIIGTNSYTLVGTNSYFYSILGTTLTNITPLVTTTTAIANSLATNYTTLGSNPLTTVLSSKTVTVAHTAHKLVAGNVIKLSGVPGAVNGIPAAELNTTLIVRSVPTANSYTIMVATTAATSSGSGGGASVIEATSIITVTQAAHGFANGDRVKILAATSIGGIPNTEINIEHIIKNVTTNTYDFTNTTIATSSVSGGGGASTTVQGQIAAGSANASAGVGYGMGLYGAGLYGVAKYSSNGQLIQPRIWSIDRFGNNVILSPGNQTGVYQWLGSNNVAPSPLTNAPTAVNWVFESDSIIVTMGASNVPNRLQWCDQGNSTIWTATAQNQAGQDDIEGANQFISQINVRGVNLLWTANQLYTFQYIGLPLIWNTTQVDDAQGIIAPNARVTYNGVAYWMSQDNFFLYNGGVVSEMPNCTVRKYVFNDINRTQQAKCFVWMNRKFGEIWFHYPSSNSNEPDRYVIYSVNEQHWTIGTMNRSAGLIAHNLTQYPVLASPQGGVFYHEKTYDDNGSPLSFTLTTKKIMSATDHVEISRLVPDSIQTGDINVLSECWNYAQDTVTVSTESNIISPDTNYASGIIQGLVRQHTISQSVLGGYWRAGTWLERIQEGTPE